MFRLSKLTICVKGIRTWSCGIYRQVALLSCSRTYRLSHQAVLHHRHLRNHRPAGVAAWYPGGKRERVHQDLCPEARRRGVQGPGPDQLVHRRPAFLPEAGRLQPVHHQGELHQEPRLDQIPGKGHLHRLRPEKHDPPDDAPLLGVECRALLRGHHRWPRDRQSMRGHQGDGREGPREKDPDFLGGCIQEHWRCGDEWDRRLSLWTLPGWLHRCGHCWRATEDKDWIHRSYHQSHGDVFLFSCPECFYFDSDFMTVSLSGTFH